VKEVTDATAKTDETAPFASERRSHMPRFLSAMVVATALVAVLLGAPVVALNPQPLPPGHDASSLNPQPLPPRYLDA
jgi:hypothetical protein